MASDSLPHPQTPRSVVRGILLFVLLFSITGSIAELLLIDHYEDRLQLIPLITYGVALLSLIAAALMRSRAAARFAQVMMIAMALTGLLGIILHFRANAEFQMDIDPDLTTSQLIFKSLRATAPPALAPGIMVTLALVGWAYLYDNPAVQRRSSK